MKNLKLLVLLVSMSLISFSCGSDDDGDGGSSASSDSVLIFGDAEYQLESGTIEDYGEYSDGVYNFDIVLVTSDISTINGETEAVDDTYTGIYFELFTSNSGDLEEGVYTLGDNIEAGSFVYANIFVESSSDEYTSFDIDSGTFTVLEDGSTYEFEFEGTVSNGTSFSGYYRGSLLSFDYSSELDRSSTTNLKKKRKF
ncbi:hypothetical protein [Winogradskyella ludwigii]|jgi:hypothetical protein|uniref:hypothetical protein n=1 Tax=Winogradskyella ludwigii TaxID=2686076 RepID=UPI0015CD4AA4|nr:hypothetical protein [Winogradskyella ludwigii]